MEKVYTGNRLADGNKVVPPEITLKSDHMIIKEAGINGRLIKVAYEDIVEIETNTPLIGFSSITLGYTGAKVTVKTTFSKKEISNDVGDVQINGLSKSDVTMIKTIIENEGFDDEDDDDEDDLETPETDNAPDFSQPEPQTFAAPAQPAPQTESAGSSLEGMYDPHLERLITAALADGELSEKKKQILFKNAEAKGIDLDEFEMILEARLYERKEKMKKEK